jgi:hypothetical protein
VSRFDVEAEKARAHYAFVNVTAQSWYEQPPPAIRTKGKRLFTAQ